MRRCNGTLASGVFREGKGEGALARLGRRFLLCTVWVTGATNSRLWASTTFRTPFFSATAESGTRKAGGSLPLRTFFSQDGGYGNEAAMLPFRVVPKA